ncbi:MAG: prolipoprotein diacylglyceryl transferase family protein [Bacteroidota bacterium]
MYPRISDFFNDVFGLNICLPIQSFGFFLAMAFIACFIAIRYELRRKTQVGIFPTREVVEEQGGPIPISDVIISSVIYFLLGYKFFLMLENYAGFCDNPQDMVLSTDGSFIGGLVAAGIFGGIRFYQYNKRKDEKPKKVNVQKGIADELGPIFLIAFLAGIIGAKVFHNIEYWEDFLKDPMGQLLSFNGLTFYGGMICGAVGILWYVHSRGYRILPFADAGGMVLMLGYGVGRVGCHVAGDGDWGIVNKDPKPNWLSWLPDNLWSYNYPNNVLERCGQPGCKFSETPYLIDPVFPTPVYEVVMALSIFTFLWLIRKRLPYWGQLMSIYLVLNGLERFLIEKIRVNTADEYFGIVLTQAEIISFTFMLMGIVLFILSTFKWKQNLKNTPVKPLAKT